ncbi:MAG TPA: phosphoglycerate mutase family protein [Epsilonproteobacteria bacterium]|nr:phosphoglycerate mutase family protein [Campylobacterota bacterium]
MKEIILIRHAKVDIDNSQKIDALKLQAWVDAYDHAPIDAKSLPSDETKRLVQRADVVLTSTLRRAIDSAKVLGVDAREENSSFNEAAIPKVHIPFIKLKPKHWLMILRMLLLLGLGKKDTSLKASKRQAEKAAQILQAYAKEHDVIVLVGHGGMHWLIRIVLMKEGWVLHGKASNRNWGATVLKGS